MSIKRSDRVERDSSNTDSSSFSTFNADLVAFTQSARAIFSQWPTPSGHILRYPPEQWRIMHLHLSNLRHTTHPTKLMICQHNLSHRCLRHYYLGHQDRVLITCLCSILYSFWGPGLPSHFCSGRVMVFPSHLSVLEDFHIPLVPEIIKERIILRSLSANIYLQLHQRPHRLRRVCQQPVFYLLWPVRPLRPFVPRQPNSAVTATSLATHTSHLIYPSVGRSAKSR